MSGNKVGLKFFEFTYMSTSRETVLKVPCQFCYSIMADIYVPYVVGLQQVRGHLLTRKSAMKVAQPKSKP